MSEIDLTGFIDITGNGGILKKILQEGSGDSPPEGYEVIAHYTGTLDDGSKFDSSRDRGQPFKFTIGKGQVIKGWDQGFATMKKGEKAILRIREDYGYGKHGSGSIPGGATLTFDVELINFKPKKKEKWELTVEEKIADAIKLKDQGTEAFKEKLFDDAIESYSDAADLVDGETGEAATIFVACKLNIAQCYINIKDYPSAIEASSKVLTNEPTNVKALYRRALARNAIGMPDEAKEDLEIASGIDPENAAVKTELAKSKKLIAAANKKEKAAYGNLFSKISVYDDKKVEKKVEKVDDAADDDDEDDEN
jgi:peptidylprolyl isomerase